MTRKRADPAGTATRVVVALIALSGAAAPAIGATVVAHKPPVVLVLPVAPVHGTDVLELRARVYDPSGVGTVRLHARGEHETRFREYPMVGSGTGDEYVAHVVDSPDRGENVQYFVEATDVRHNGPRRAGTARSPFVAKILPPAAAQEQARKSRALWSVAALISFTALFLAAYSYVLRCERAAPALETAGPASRSRKIAKRVRPTVDRDRFWRKSERAPNGNRRGAAPAKVCSLDVARQRVEDEVFWLRLLRPVLPLPKTRAEAALRDLAARPHVHPHFGSREYDVKTLRERLEWARSFDPNGLVERWQATHSKPAANVRPHAEGAKVPRRTNFGKRAAGVSLIELLVVLALMSITLGIGALYLRPAAAPLESGAELVEALFKQTRAKAMSTTTVHRVRPFDADSLVVEYASACSSPTWTVDPRMDLDLPDRVTLADTDWKACFTSRGVTTQNFVVTLQHPDIGSQRLELLLGGAVRWLP